MRILLGLLFIIIFAAPVAASPQKNPSRNAVVLIDSFDVPDTYRTQAGGTIGGDETAPGTCSVSYETDPRKALGGAGASLKVAYDVSDRRTFTYCYIGIDNAQKETARRLAGKRYLGFWVRGESGGEQFKVEVHSDDNGDGRFDPKKETTASVPVNAYVRGKGISARWQKVLIPFNHFKKLRDPSKICEIVFVFENGTGPGKSAVHIDDCVFGGAIAGIARTKDLFSGDSFAIDDRAPRDGYQFRAETKLSAVLERDGIESVRFEISDSGTNRWRRIATAYNSGDNAFGAVWNPAALDGINSFNLRAVAVSQRGYTYPIGRPVRNCDRGGARADDLLAALEKRAFMYFCENQSPRTGLFRDTAGSGDASIAVTGFGLTALCIGAERGWIGKKEAEERAILALRTFSPSAAQSSYPAAEGKDGFFYHFLDFDTAKRAGQSEVSNVDTAILLCGMLTAGEYFGGAVRDMALAVYAGIDWEKFIDQKALPAHKLFLMGWAPEEGFLKWRWDYYSDEAILVTLMAIGSPVRQVSPEVFYDWTRQWGSYEGSPPFIYSWIGPLFTYQYANLWFDFRNRSDRNGVNWYRNSANAIAAHRRFCMEEAASSKAYGPEMWGISSVETPDGYTMSQGAFPNGERCARHDGTISPFGAAASVMLTPFNGYAAMEYIYYAVPKTRGKYGFINSFNQATGFRSKKDYGLDCGTFLLAAENFRSGFVWKYFMRSDCVRQALKRAGFSEEEKAAAGVNEEELRRLPAVLQKEGLSCEELYNAVEEMEELVRNGDIESYRMFEKYQLQIYGGILRQVQRNSAVTRADAEFLRFAAHLRLYRFARARKDFERFEAELRACGDQDGRLNKTEAYLKRLLGMRLTEQYIARLTAMLVREVKASGTAQARWRMKLLGDEACGNEAYPEAFRLYSSFIELTESQEPAEEVIAHAGAIVSALLGRGKYEYAAEMDRKKISLMIETVQDGTILERELAQACRRYYDARYYPGAEKFADLFLKKFPSSEIRDEMLFLRGQARRYGGDTAGAMDDMRDVVKRARSSDVRGRALLQLGESLMLKEKSAEALKCFDEILSRYKSSDLYEIALYNKGLACLQAGDREAAQQSFREVAKSGRTLDREAKAYLEKMSEKQK